MYSTLNHEPSLCSEESNAVLVQTWLEQGAGYRACPTFGPWVIHREGQSDSPGRVRTHTQAL